MKHVERLRRIEQWRAALLDEVAGMDPAALRQRPLAGKWSILEIIEHLVLSEQDVLGECLNAAAVPASSHLSPSLLRYHVVVFVLRFHIPVRTPSPAMVPTGTRSFLELRQAWEEHHQRLQDFLGRLSPEGLRQTPFAHPVAGPLTPAQALNLLNIHLSGHIRQIRRLQRLLTLQ